MGFMVWWIGIIIVICLSFALMVKKVIKKLQLESQGSTDSINLKTSILRRFVLIMTKENPYKKRISFKMECARKSFHLLGLLLIVIFFGLFFLPPLSRIVNENIITFIKDSEWLYNLLWGDINDYPYDKRDFQAIIDITMFVLIAALVLAIISDLIRVLWGPEYSIMHFLTKSILRNKEFNAIGPQIYLISGLIFSYTLYVIGFAHILVFVTAMLIACFSDALAALIGRKYGKHKVKCIGGDIKSIEGFVAGAGSAYLIGLILIGPIYALIAAIIFLILDYFPVVIADNILNPILITLGITIGVILLGFPIGLF